MHIMYLKSLVALSTQRCVEGRPCASIMPRVVSTKNATNETPRKIGIEEPPKKDLR